MRYTLYFVWSELCALLRLTSLIEQCRTLYRHPLIINILPVSTTTKKDIFFFPIFSFWADDGYSRNESCELNMISKFLFVRKYLSFIFTNINF
jgi:hypothetical protein